MHFSTKSNQSNLIPEYFSVCCAFFFSYCCLSHSHSRNTGTCFPSLWKLGREHSSVSKQALKGLEQNTEGFRVVEQKQYLCLLPLLFPGKKNGQNVSLSWIHKLELSDTKINVSHLWVTYRRNAFWKQTCWLLPWYIQAGFIQISVDLHSVFASKVQKHLHFTKVI